MRNTTKKNKLFSRHFDITKENLRRIIIITAGKTIEVKTPIIIRAGRCLANQPKEGNVTSLNNMRERRPKVT